MKMVNGLNQIRFVTTTGLYSAEFPTTYQKWVPLDEARMWNSFHAVKSHIAYCRKNSSSSTPIYAAPMEIVEVEKQVTDKGLIKKI